MPVESTSPEQLTLPLTRKQALSFQNFVVTPSNQEPCAHLEAFARGKLEAPYVYLQGALGTGKSHLLQAACQCWMSVQTTAIYLPLQTVLRYTPSVFERLEHYTFIAVDDVQRVAGQPVWEEALFHLFNRVMAAGQRLLISAVSYPDQLGLHLPDLVSRLKSGMVFSLTALTESEMRALLQVRAKVLGLSLSDRVLAFLLNHLQRDMSTLLNTLSILDAAAWQTKRKVTIPLIKSVLRDVAKPYFVT